MAESEPNPVATQDGLWKAECARRTLLSHLGITPLVSRFDPVAAKPAQRLGLPTGFNDVTSMDDHATSNGDDEMRDVTPGGQEAWGTAYRDLWNQQASEMSSSLNSRNPLS